MNSEGVIRIDAHRGNNLFSIQEMNRSLVLKLLKKQSASSRAQLSKQTGLQQATITNIINDFIVWGIVKETGRIEGVKGRKSISLAINDKDYFVAGLRLTRKYFWIGIYSITGEQIDVKKEYINSYEGPRMAVEKMKKSTVDMLGKHKDKNILALGVALPGPYYPKKGKLDVITDFPGWENIHIKEEFCNFFDIPVILDHDANAGAMAEWWIAPNSLQSGTMVYLAVGQGIGAGIVHNGKIFKGALGTAGEIGHASIDINGHVCECGNRGCLTNYASTSALLNEIKEARIIQHDSKMEEQPTIENTASAIRAKDPLVCNAFKKTIWYLCAGINSAICSYGPSEIIIGDEMSIIGQPLLDTIEEIMNTCGIKSLINQVDIKLTSFDYDPAIAGSAALAIDYALSNSHIFSQ